MAGFGREADHQRSYANIDRQGIQRVRERVTEIDRSAAVVVAGGQRIGYDFVLSPGIDYMEEAVQGYAAARAAAGGFSGLRAGGGAAPGRRLPSSAAANSSSPCRQPPLPAGAVRSAPS
ncbi:MAG: hypothetical protein IPM99_17620 [Rubrivivax sp.]|nr:hypothetical protein [Rubrivivax sp.]